MAQHSSQQAGKTPRRRTFDTAVGRGRDCLKANTKRVRLAARNPARAALAALSRQGVEAADARSLDLHIAIYAGDNPAMPIAVFAVAGAERSPELRLLYARTLPADSPLLAAGGPLDRARVRSELPRAVRRRAEARLGDSGLREILSEAFWQREFSLYAGTAAVLTALGFPMSPGVFVAGGLLLLVQGAARLAWQEARLALLQHRIARDEVLQPALRAAAAHRVFARAHGLDRDMPPAMLQTRVLRGDIAVPDLRSAEPLRLLVDEDARIAVGGLPLASVDGPGDPVEPWNVPHGRNFVTMVFRTRSRRRSHRPAARNGAERPAGRLQSRPGLPSCIDITDIGSARDAEGDDIEVIDAELLDSDDLPVRRGDTFA